MYDSFLGSGCKFINFEDDFYQATVKKITTILLEADNYGFKKQAMEFIFKCWNVDTWLTALVPLHVKIWYEAYGKEYWLPNISDAGYDAEPVRYHNHILNMWWHDDWKEWGTLQENDKTINSDEDGEKQQNYKGRTITFPVTIMLPPTVELMDRQYKEDLKPFIETPTFRSQFDWLYSEKLRPLLPHIHPKAENERGQSWL